MNKNALFSCFFLVFSGLLFAQQKFPSDKELYPAVYGAFVEKYPGSTFTNIDFYNNVYKLENSTVYDGIILPNRIDVVVKLLPSGIIDISFENRYIFDAKTDKYVASKSKTFLFYNWKKFVSEISTKIYEIANSPAEYEKYEKAAMADIKFVYAIMKNFTDLAFKDFIENYAKGSIFQLEGFVSDVKESNREINKIKYKYLVTLSQKLNESTDIYCFFYTNRNDVIRLSKTSVYKISATLIGASQGSIGNSLVLELVASD